VARFTEDQLAAVCLSPGVPIPEAAVYAGDLHPLVVVFQQGGDPTGWDLSKYLPYDINTQYYSDLWPSPIQLVVCVGQSQVRVDSCGTYKRADDGVVGQVIRYKQANTVRVIVAATGKVLTSKTFYGTLPDCAASIDLWSDGPPWSIWGDSAADDVINAYAVTASTQKG
jgi:hypothetical protein